jgi:hypothetical protein
MHLAERLDVVQLDLEICSSVSLFLMPLYITGIKALIEHHSLSNSMYVGGARQAAALPRPSQSLKLPGAQAKEDREFTVGKVLGACVRTLRC